jgi:hypothetical protein
MARDSYGLTLGSILLGSAGALNAAEPQPPAGPPAVQSELRIEQGNRFIARGLGESENMHDWRQRLADPAQRAQLRAETRASMEAQYPDLAEALALEPAVAAKVIDLLTDHQLQTIERMVSGTGSRLVDLQDYETRRLDELRKVLGARGLEQYLDYSESFGQRAQVNRLDTRLSAADKLRPEQKQRLMRLFADEAARETEVRHRSHRGRRLRGPSFAVLSQEELQRESQLLTIAENERAWHRKQAADEAFEQRAAEFLTAAQQSMLAQINREDADSLRRWVESARVEAGPGVAITQTPAAEPPQPASVETKVKLDLSMKVNRNEQKTVTLIGAGGEAMSFEAGDGLIAEVIPTVFEDRSMDLRLNYYEERSTGKRRLPSSSIIYVGPEDSPSCASGETGTVVTGSRSYIVTFDVCGAELPNP